MKSIVFLGLICLGVAQHQNEVVDDGSYNPSKYEDPYKYSEQYHTPQGQGFPQTQQQPQAYQAQPQQYYQPQQPQQPVYQPQQPQPAYQPQPSYRTTEPRNAAILTDARYLNGDGKFGASYTQEDGVSFKEESDPDGTRRGTYSYVDPTGQRKTVSYTAGKHGFQAFGDHLPVGPQGSPQAVPQQGYQPQQQSYQQPQAYQQPLAYQQQPQYRPAPQVYEPQQTSAQANTGVSASGGGYSFNSQF